MLLTFAGQSSGWSRRRYEGGWSGNFPHLSLWACLLEYNILLCFLLILPSRKTAAVSISSVCQLPKLRSPVFFSLKCSVIWKQSIHGPAYLSEGRKNRSLNIWTGIAVHSRQQIRYRWKKSVSFELETQQSHKDTNLNFIVNFNPGVSFCEYACRPFRLSIRIKEQNYRKVI